MQFYVLHHRSSFESNGYVVHFALPVTLWLAIAIQKCLGIDSSLQSVTGYIMKVFVNQKENDLRVNGA